MKKKIFLLLMVMGIVLPYTAFAEEESRYIFKQNYEEGFIYDNAIRVLEIFKFPILKAERDNGYIETDWHLLRRTWRRNFTIKYIISVTKTDDDDDNNKPVIKVNAQIKKYSGSKKKICEMKWAWWLIKKVVGITGK